MRFVCLVAGLLVVDSFLGKEASFADFDARNCHGDFYEGTCWECLHNVWR